MTNAVEQITNSISPINGLDVVNAVNGFYSSAFNNTVWLLGILIGLLGIVVPTAYYFLQNRQLALKEKALTEHLEKEVAKFESSLRKTNLESIEAEKVASAKRFEILEKKIQVALAEAQAGILHLQGNFELSQGNTAVALTSFSDAIEKYIEASNLISVQQNVRFIIDSVLPQMKKDDFVSEYLKIDRFQKALQISKKAESHGLLIKDIEKLEKAFAEAQKRNK